MSNRINKRQSGYSLKWLPIQIHPDVALFTMVFCKSNSAFLVCTFIRSIISNLKDKNRKISIKLSRTKKSKQWCHATVEKKKGKLYGNDVNSLA